MAYFFRSKSLTFSAKGSFETIVHYIKLNTHVLDAVFSVQ